MNLIEDIRGLTQRTIEAINEMSNIEVSYNNIGTAFEEHPKMSCHALNCVDVLEAEGIDSRGLSIAFRNLFLDHERSTFDETTCKVQYFVNDMPYKQIYAIMTWLTNHALEISPLEIKRVWKLSEIKTNVETYN